MGGGRFKVGPDAYRVELVGNKDGVNPLSSNPAAGNRAFGAGQVSDLAAKLEAAEAATHGGGPGLGMARAGRNEDGPLAKVTRDAALVALEQAKGMTTQLVKDALFNWVPTAVRGEATGMSTP